MSLEDPFFVVKDEVTKALNRTRGLYQRWKDLQKEEVIFSNKDNLQRTSTELRNSIRSIEWDLEDLEDTIAIVEKNPGRFRLDSTEVIQRRFFIQSTRDEIADIKDKVQIQMRGRDVDHTARKPLLENVSSPTRQSRSSQPSTNSAGYVRIPMQNDSECDDDGQVHNIMQQQASLVRQQDDQLVLISGSVGALKSMSRQIGTELDEQALMLDDMGHEMENAESKMDSTLKKMAKVLHMSNDRRQWMAIGILTGVMVIVIILLFVL